MQLLVWLGAYLFAGNILHFLDQTALEGLPAKFATATSTLQSRKTLVLLRLLLIIRLLFYELTFVIYYENKLLCKHRTERSPLLVCVIRDSPIHCSIAAPRTQTDERKPILSAGAINHAVVVAAVPLDLDNKNWDKRIWIRGQTQ